MATHPIVESMESLLRLERLDGSQRSETKLPGKHWQTFTSRGSVNGRCCRFGRVGIFPNDGVAFGRSPLPYHYELRQKRGRLSVLCFCQPGSILLRLALGDLENREKMAGTSGMQLLHPPPPSNNVVRVRMVDTTSVMKLHAEAFLKPVMPGHEIMSVIDLAFLIENPRLGKKAMFDLGTRKDYWNSPPWTIKRIEAAIPGVRVDKDVTEILQEKGMDLGEISEFCVHRRRFQEAV